jgi:hypothetical protein
MNEAHNLKLSYTTNATTEFNIGKVQMYHTLETGYTE